jgi:hypothetical protein
MWVIAQIDGIKWSRIYYEPSINGKKICGLGYNADKYGLFYNSKILIGLGYRLQRHDNIFTFWASLKIMDPFMTTSINFTITNDQLSRSWHDNWHDTILSQAGANLHWSGGQLSPSRFWKIVLKFCEYNISWN